MDMKRTWLQGPCAFCDHPQASHRVYDAVVDRVGAGELLEDVLPDHMVDPADWPTLKALIESVTV